MDKLMAYCGLLCSDCGAYKATVSNDDALRKQTSEEWSKMYGANINAADINCLGCKSEATFGYCKICKIRECNIQKNLSNCSECDLYSCDNLEGILKAVPEVRERLNKLRK